MYSEIFKGFKEEVGRSPLFLFLRTNNKMKKYNLNLKEIIKMFLLILSMLFLGSFVNTLKAQAAELPNDIIVSNIQRRDNKRYFIAYQTDGGAYYISFFNKEDVTFSNHTTVIEVDGDFIEYGVSYNMSTFKDFIYGKTDNISGKKSSHIEIRKNLLLASNCDFDVGKEHYEQFEYKNGQIVTINKIYGMTAQEIWEATLGETFGIMAAILTVVIVSISIKKGLSFIKRTVEVA